MATGRFAALESARSKYPNLRIEGQLLLSGQRRRRTDLPYSQRREWANSVEKLGLNLETGP